MTGCAGTQRAGPGETFREATISRAALRLLFEWLVVVHVLDVNPVFKSREHEPGR
jgi:hypothetical protein